MGPLTNPNHATTFSAFSVKGEPRDFKFGTHSKSQPADEKSSLKGVWSGSGDPF